MNWGILSTAAIGRNSVIPAINSSQTGSKVTGIASRSLLKAERAAIEIGAQAFGSYEDLLMDSTIESVYIPLPTGMHFEWAMKALEANKHILLEKSAVVTLSEAEQLILKAKDKKKLIMEHFQFQYHSQHKFVHETIKEGRIGDIRSFRSSFGFPPFGSSKNIRYQKELGGGALLDAGAYTLKALTFILGFGFSVDSSYLVNNTTYNIDWYGGGQLSNKNKSIFGQVAFGFDNFYQCNYEVWGSQGKLTSTKAFTAKPGFEPKVILETSTGIETITLPADNHFERIIESFQSIVENGFYENEYVKILTQASLIDQFKRRNTNNS